MIQHMWHIHQFHKHQPEHTTNWFAFSGDDLGAFRDLQQQELLIKLPLPPTKHQRNIPLQFFLSKINGKRKQPSQEHHQPSVLDHHQPLSSGASLTNFAAKNSISSLHGDPVSSPKVLDHHVPPTSAPTMPNKDTKNYLGTHVDPLVTQDNPEDPQVAPEPDFCTQNPQHLPP